MGILLTLKKSKPWSYTELVICKTTVHKSVYLYVISRTDHMTLLQWDGDSDGITTLKSFHEIWQRSHNYATSNCKDPLLVLVRSAHFTHRYRSGRASHSGPTITYSGRNRHCTCYYPTNSVKSVKAIRKADIHKYDTGFVDFFMPGFMNSG